VCAQCRVQNETVIGVCTVHSVVRLIGVCTVHSVLRLLLVCVHCTVQ